MSDTDKQIDRKANTPTVEDDAGERTDGGEDLRPDLEHFTNFDGDRVRKHIPTVPPVDVSIVGVAMAVMYALVAAGALSVAYGTTSLAAAHGGFYVALIVGGTFAFAYGYVGLRVVHTATQPAP